MGTRDTTQSPIKVGIIGTGYGFSTLLPTISTIDDYEVISVAGSGDPKTNPYSAELMKMGILPATSEDLLRNDQIELVVIASPPSTQERHAISALESGKNIYCEKPVGLNADSTQRILEVAARNQKIATVGYQFRYDPSIQWLMKQVSSGNLGEIHRVDIQWETSGANKVGAKTWRDQRELGGGVLRDFACHVFDYLSVIDPVSFPVEAEAFNVEDHSFRRNNTDPDLQTMDFSAQIGDVHLDCLISRNAVQPIGHAITLHGSSRTARVIHRTPFGLEDICAEYWTDQMVKTSAYAELGLDEVALELQAHGLNIRQNSARRLFVDLAHAFNGVPTVLLPDLSQAVSNQHLVDEAEGALFS